MYALTDLLTKRYWIFDLDGTLTLPQHDFAAIRTELGIPEGEGILEYLQQLPEPQHSQLNRRLDQIERDLARQCQAMPGAVELVRRLAENDTKLAILTRNRRECVDIALRRLGLEDYFPSQQIIASHCAEPKPAPDGVLQLLQRWGCGCDQCVIVGDFLYDLQAGRGAGISTVHFNPQGKRRWPDWTDLELDSFAPLINALPG